MFKITSKLTSKKKLKKGNSKQIHELAFFSENVSTVAWYSIIMYRNKEGFKNENFITHIFKQSAQAADVVQCAVGAGSSSCTQSKSMSSSCTRPTSWSSIGPRITSRNTLQHSLVWKSFHFYFQSCQYTSYFELNRVSVTLDQIESFRVKLCQIYQIDLKKTSQI